MRPYRTFRLQRGRGRVVDSKWVMYRRIIGPLFMLSALFLVPEAWGAVRYVSKSGTDNPTCTQAAPCRTIQHAVDIADSGDTISIGKGKFTENSGVSIAKDLTLNGKGSFGTRVFGYWAGFSVFSIEPGATVTIAELAVRNGNTVNGGGISNHGNLTLDRVWVRTNHANDYGGGIMNWWDGTLSMSKSEIAYNSADTGGGGLANHGGHVLLDEVRVVANTAGFGAGGVYNSSGFAGQPDYVMYLAAIRSLIADNDGNGIENYAHMMLKNTTVSRNGRVGIMTGYEGDTELTHVTVADNGKLDHYPNGTHGGLQGLPGSSITLTNTIVANNAPVQCNFGIGPLYNLASGSLVSDDTCALLVSGGYANLVGVDPKLGPLKWNGGLTATHALKKGSPAIDAGYPDHCEPVDQRGVLRLIDGDGDGEVNCDIGAFEYIPFWKKFDQ